MGTLTDKPKSSAAMMEDVAKMVEKRNGLKDCHDEIDFQTEYVVDLCTAAGYNADVGKSAALFHKWEHDKDDNISTYRDKSFTCIYTGTPAPKMKTPWLQAFDDSTEAFVKN